MAKEYTPRFSVSNTQSIVVRRTVRASRFFAEARARLLEGQIQNLDAERAVVLAIRTQL